MKLPALQVRHVLVLLTQLGLMRKATTDQVALSAHKLMLHVSSRALFHKVRLLHDRAVLNVLKKRADQVLALWIMEVIQDRVAQVAEGLQASQVVLAAAQEALQEVVLLAAVDQVLPRTAQDLATLLRRRDKILQVNN